MFRAEHGLKLCHTLPEACLYRVLPLGADLVLAATRRGKRAKQPVSCIETSHYVIEDKRARRVYSYSLVRQERQRLNSK